MQTPALIFLNLDGANVHTNAPTGLYSNSGFELQGFFSFFQGTPIGPHHFITAAHIGGVVGWHFYFQGNDYTTIANAKDPSSDLIIWEVDGTFSTFAQLYTGTDEANKEVVILGRGALKGGPVTVGGTLKGWQWGDWDHLLRWGRNTVASVQNDAGQPSGDLPHFLQADFDANGPDDEAHLAVGDSGGGVFIRSAGVWKLAGINYAVDGPFNTQPAGNGFNAALFDAGGLYLQDELGVWQPIPDLPTPQPSSLYATRISARLDWIQPILATRTAITPAILTAAAIVGPYSTDPTASIDSATKTISVPIGSGSHFLQLQSTVALTIVNIHIEGSNLVVQYQ